MGITFTKELVPDKIMTEKPIIKNYGIDPPPYKDTIISKLVKCESLYTAKRHENGKCAMEYILVSIEKLCPYVSMHHNEDNSLSFSGSSNYCNYRDLFYHFNCKETKNWIVEEFKKNGIDFTCSNEKKANGDHYDYSWSWELHFTSTPEKN